MKLTAIALITLAYIAPAYADEDANDPMKQMVTMVQCQAVELSLMQEHNQFAASIAALSPTPPAQLALLRDSYRAMAADELARVQAMGKLTKEVILPKTGEPDGSHYMAALSNAIEAVQTGLGMTDYDTQVKVQAKMLDVSRSCEAFVAHLDKASSY